MFTGCLSLLCTLPPLVSNSYAFLRLLSRLDPTWLCLCGIVRWWVWVWARIWFASRSCRLKGCCFRSSRRWRWRRWLVDTALTMNSTPDSFVIALPCPPSPCLSFTTTLQSGSGTQYKPTASWRSSTYSLNFNCMHFLGISYSSCTHILNRSEFRTQVMTSTLQHRSDWNTEGLGQFWHRRTGFWRFGFSWWSRFGWDSHS